jgi:hypothetical protein
MTDDRTTIQNMINVGAGGLVTIPNGTYSISQHPGNFWCLTIPQGTILRGESRDGVVLQQAPGLGTSVQLIQVEAPDVTIESMTLDGNKSNQSEDPHRAGIFAKGAPRVTFRNVTAFNFTGDGFYIYDGSDDATVYNCLATNNDRNGLTLGGRTTGGTFTNSQFTANVAEQFDSEGGSPINNVVITGCLFDGMGRSNDYVLTMTGHSSDTQSSGWVVTHNTVNGPALILHSHDMIYADNVGVNPTDKSSLLVYRSNDRILISRNVLSKTGAGKDQAIINIVGTGLGQSSGDVLVSKNVLSTTASVNGVNAVCARDVIVVDNTITGSGITAGGEAGIFVRTTRVEEPVNSAIIQRNTVSGFGNYGVFLGGNGEAKIMYVDISNNSFTNVPAMRLNDDTNAAQDVVQHSNQFTGTLIVPCGAAVPWGNGTRWTVPTSE